MTYHRTTGKGGTINTSRDAPFPNFNKSTVGGNKAKPRTGKNHGRVPAGQRGSGSGQNNPGHRRKAY